MAYFIFQHVDFLVSGNADFISKDGEQVTYVYEACSITEVLVKILDWNSVRIEDNAPDHDAGGLGFYKGMVEPRIKDITETLHVLAKHLTQVDLTNANQRCHFVHLITCKSGYIVWNADKEEFYERLKRNIIAYTMDAPTVKLFNGE